MFRPFLACIRWMLTICVLPAMEDGVLFGRVYLLFGEPVIVTRRVLGVTGAPTPGGREFGITGSEGRVSGKRSSCMGKSLMLRSDD